MKALPRSSDGTPPEEARATRQLPFGGGYAAEAPHTHRIETSSCVRGIDCDMQEYPAQRLTLYSLLVKLGQH